jgi:hypothetical protein
MYMDVKRHNNFDPIYFVTGVDEEECFTLIIFERQVVHQGHDL